MPWRIIQIDTARWTPLQVWLGWVGLQIAAVLLVLGLLSAMLALPGAQAKDLVGPVLLLGLPFGLGLAQGLVLRGRSIHPVGWMLVSAAALPLSFFLGLLLQWVLPEFILERSGWVGGQLFFGIVAGSLQWWVLRRRFPHAWVWIPAVAFGWALLEALTGSRFDTWWGYLGIGLVPALICGAALAWLWNQALP